MATEYELYSGAYTGAQIDNAVSEVQTTIGESESLTSAITSIADTEAASATADKITLADAFGVGTAITATSSSHVDLDTITAVGRYQCGQSACQYVDHMPEIGIYRGFSLFVFTNTAFTTAQRYVQQLRYNDVNQAGCFYERFKTGNDEWSDWYKFTGDKYPYALTNTDLQRSVQPTNLLRTQRAALLTSGVSITPTKDGTYKLDGTASAGLSIIKSAFFKDLPSSYVGKTLKLTGGISSNISLRVYTSTSSSTAVYEDTGAGVTFTLTSEMLTDPYDIRIAVKNGTDCTGVEVKPMLCVADESGAFLPYIPTNDELRRGAGRFDFSKLKGTSYVAIGDSITEYQGTTGHPHETKGWVYGYIEAIEDEYGVVCTNIGVAGHTIADDISTLLSRSYSGVSLVTIGYGTNDARTSLTLGDVTDTYDAQTPTFCGALNSLIAKIYGDNPFCNIIVLSPIQRGVVNDFGPFTPNANGETLEDFANACVSVAARNATPCVDLFHSSRINSATIATFLKDGVHPNNFGYKAMFSAMRAALLNILIPKD